MIDALLHAKHWHEHQHPCKNFSRTWLLPWALWGMLEQGVCRDADKVSRRIADVLKNVASLEILQAPGLTFKIPELFASIPRLTGVLSVDSAMADQATSSCSARPIVIPQHEEPYNRKFCRLLDDIDDAHKSRYTLNLYSVC